MDDHGPGPIGHQHMESEPGTTADDRETGETADHENGGQRRPTCADLCLFDEAVRHHAVRKSPYPR